MHDIEVLLYLLCVFGTCDTLQTVAVVINLLLNLLFLVDAVTIFVTCVNLSRLSFEVRDYRSLIEVPVVIRPRYNCVGCFCAVQICLVVLLRLSVS